MAWYSREGDDDLIVSDYQDIVRTLDSDYGCLPSSDLIWCKDDANYQLTSNKSMRTEPTDEEFWNEYSFQGYEDSENISACCPLSEGPTYGESSSIPNGALQDLQDSEINSTTEIDDIYLTSFFEESFDDRIPSTSMSIETMLPQSFIDPRNTLKSDGCMDVMDFQPNSNEQHQQLDCLEASVLQELEDIMTQFTVKERICFRDSLYRLAQTSRHSSVYQSSAISAGDRDTSISFRGSESEDLKRNAFDRTVANLMFNQKNCNISY